MTPEEAARVLVRIYREIDPTAPEQPQPLDAEDLAYCQTVAEISRRLASVPCFTTNELSEFRRITREVTGETLDIDETDVVALWICRRFNQETSN